MSRYVHDLPGDDVIDHAPDEYCICGPVKHLLEYVGPMRAPVFLVSHARLDGRPEPGWPAMT